ncbi:glucose-6-phosphate isomerase [Thalassotalea ponticola]|uniref:glucose-6-phosphate isomerase n=1 Tax=Thalassotalea ponticola TaxID=1523392 RepID=UPI0025B450E7|nr:glucose-6-phosphate isomerase [Thalassotalea ponticola]MDN3653553.1 glucose-6-phosphate isomerase [Thalassotalea ponticola]
MTRSSLPAWQALQKHAEDMQQQSIKALFDTDSKRFERFSVQRPGLLFDYSKQNINQLTMALFAELAEQCQFTDWRAKMFAGERINITEDRSVLHVALRRDTSQPLLVDGTDVSQQVAEQLAKMKQFCQQVHSGQWRGYTDKPIRHIVSIGVGGSNLGPEMTTNALKAYKTSDLTVHYASNVDGNQIADVLDSVDIETTLFIISSKTFTTSETMTNANTAVKHLLAAAGDKSAIAKHFVAVSTNTEKVTQFGIDANNIFDMWDWVGGRFSLWSTIGLPIALYLGYEQFEQLLQGARDIDQHFQTAPLEKNIPFIMACLSVWNCSFLNARSQVILPYDQVLHRLTAYLQQAEMESNGKHVNFAGDTVDYNTVPTIWGEIGINGQHAFYQYLHQGNNIVPADFIGSITPIRDIEQHHDILIANMFAQAEALMCGVSEQEVRSSLAKQGKSDDEINLIAPHKVHQGNRPSSMFLFDKITPYSLGQLIALYEHKIFSQGILLEVCSFDQWGVELGKGLANNIHAEILAEGEVSGHDSSTRSLINFYKANKNQS